MKLPLRRSFDSLLLGMVCLFMQTMNCEAQTVLTVQEVRIVSTSGIVAAKSADGKTVTIKLENATTGETPIVAKQGPGSTLATGAASSAMISVPSAGSFMMGPNTQVKLPMTEEKGHTLELLKGRLFFDINAEEIKKRGSVTFRLKTPAALLAVKGTQFFTSSINGVDTAGVHQGSVDVYEPASKRLVALNAGSAVLIKPGELGQERTLTKDEKAYLESYDLILAKVGNSLGMKFVSVPGTNVFICIHETRNQDYAAFAAENPGMDTEWENPMRDGIAVGESGQHPVVLVNWDDAGAFCTWLSKKEGKNYRLPTDREWSAAIGLADLEANNSNETPFELSLKLRDIFPWGKKWPPPNEFGNYADKTHKEMFPTREMIEGYYDGFPATAPVMSFKPNKLGLYDLGGNVWEHCEDWQDEKKLYHVVRGGAFSVASKTVLHSSMRTRPGPASGRADHIGFRCVLVARPNITSSP